MLGGFGASLGDYESLPYDAEVEYLESIGTQYIDTGFIPNNCVVSVTAKVAQTSTDFATFFAADNLGFVLRRLDTTQVSFSGGGWWISVNFNDTTNWHTYELSAISGTLTIDGTQKSSRIFANAQTSSLKLFHRIAQPSQAGAVLIANCKIYDQNGTLVCDFIPVRFTNEFGLPEGALYDRILGVLFRNAGTDSFIIGPDKE